MFDRENAIGIVLLLFCAVFAVVLVSGIATGTRYRFEGPAWVGTLLAIFFIGGAIWSFISRPGRRWPWQRNDDQRQDEADRTRDL
jgi:hypothetical protein